MTDIYQPLIDQNRQEARARCKAAFSKYHLPNGNADILLTKLQELQAEQVASLLHACADFEIPAADTERLVGEITAAFNVAFYDLMSTSTKH